MKERPILFSAPMVRSILDGRKKQTRRVAKGAALDALAPDMFTPEYVALPENSYCPYGVPGDRLWVRETWLPDPPIDGWSGDIEWNGCGRPISGVPEPYRKPQHCIFREGWTGSDLRWRPGIHMPRWASRITLEITKIRVERLQKITLDDCLAEGISTRVAYRELWEKLNSARGFGWEGNPWVWVLEFKQS